MAGHSKHKLTARKASTILHHGSVKGHKLTAKQRRFMGHVAGGGKGTRRKAK